MEASRLVGISPTRMGERASGDLEIRPQFPEQCRNIAEIVFRRALAERRRGGIAGRGRVCLRDFCAGGGFFHCRGLWGEREAKFAQHRRRLLLGGRRTDARGGTAGDSEVRAHCTEQFYDIAEIVFRRTLAERRRSGIAGRNRVCFRDFCAGGGLFHCRGLRKWEAEN